MSKRQQRRIRTEEALITAVRTLIVREGMDALGVNALAREAGVDKVLIYRYFDGLPGLLRAFGESGDFWPTLDEVLEEPLRQYREDRDLARMVRGILSRYLRALRSRPVTAKILAWETSGRNALTIELENTRQAWSEALIGRMVEEQIPMTRELLVLTSLLSAAFNYLTARGELKLFGDLDIESEEGWEEIFEVVERAAAAMLSS